MQSTVGCNIYIRKPAGGDNGCILYVPIRCPKEDPSSVLDELSEKNGGCGTKKKKKKKKTYWESIHSRNSKVVKVCGRFASLR